MGCNSSKSDLTTTSRSDGKGESGNVVTGTAADKYTEGGQKANKNNNNNNTSNNNNNNNSFGSPFSNNTGYSRNKKSTGAGNARGDLDSGRYAICHFCKKKILERDLNAHTVGCSEREVTCSNSWCRKIMRQGDLPKHIEECSKNQRTICPKCGVEILAIELQAHRESCQPKPCPNCNEVCITRIHKWCPMVLLAKVNLRTGPFATEMLHEKYTRNKSANDVMAQANLHVAQMQLLWRWIKCKGLIEEVIFRSVYKEMDLKKEGFAIFKAHDKINDSHVLAPKRSRSVIQPVRVPEMSSHYFPSDTKVPITGKHIERLIADIKNRILLPHLAAWRVFVDALNHLNTLPNVVRLTPPIGARFTHGRMIQGSKVVVVGDLHGQIGDLLHILQECGMPHEGNYYVFNGDFVDRGACSVEVLLIIFSLMLAFPTCVTLNRGNHECDYMNDEYGFDVEVSTKYNRNFFRLIQRCFCALPLATILSNRIFIVHGGLPRRKGVTISDISRIQRFRQIPIPDLSQPEEDEIFQDLLWSDPVEDISGWRESQRGAGVEFGPDITEEFLKNNHLELVVRSHEECPSGYEERHNRKLITIFSASNYDGPDTNLGAVCSFLEDRVEPAFHTFQIFETEYDDPQLMMNMADSFALTTPNVAGAASSFAAINSSVTRQLLRRRSKDDILRELRERIYQRRHRLMAYYSRLDRTNKGSLWMIEWVECMRNVLNLDLPWYFLRSYLVEVDENSRIWYSAFLSHFHNLLQSLWVEDWKQGVCARLVQLQRANHRSRMVSAVFNKEIVNYYEFCSVLRAIDYAISDCQLFQLFQLFNTDGRGHVSGPYFIKNLQLMANAKPDQLRWDIDAMDQLQNVVIQGRSQLPSLFKVNLKDKVLTREKFMSGMTLIGNGMRKQLTQQQKSAIYDFMMQYSNNGEITFDVFLLCMYVFDNRTISSLHMPSITEMVELWLGPIYFKNSSFSSANLFNSEVGMQHEKNSIPSLEKKFLEEL